ncbi:MAG: PD40 domain-containing protein [Chloroflexi bacterium]|nr:PD40 domain-containing protein [Chloroflexota bacterium]
MAVIREGALWVVQPNAQAPAPAQLFGAPDHAEPRWSPDGRTLSFSAGLGRASEVYTVPGSGGAPHQLTNDARPERSMAWSPDGKQLAYSLPRALGPEGQPEPRQPEEVWVLDVASGRDRKIADGFDPSWSPDGRRIVYATNGQRDDRGATRNAIHVVGANGGTDREVLAIGGIPADLLPSLGLPFVPQTIRLRAPSWSPDGTRLVASADGHTSMALIFDERGQGLRAYGLAYEGGVGVARWSPDARRLTIESQPATGVDIVTIVDLSGSEPVKIGGPQAGFAASDPAWSPDGKQVALIAANVPERASTPRWSALRLYDLTGTQQAELLTAPSLSDLDWGARSAPCSRCVDTPSPGGEGGLGVRSLPRPQAQFTELTCSRHLSRPR